MLNCVLGIQGLLVWVAFLELVAFLVSVAFLALVAFLSLAVEFVEVALVDV